MIKPPKNRIHEVHENEITTVDEKGRKIIVKKKITQPPRKFIEDLPANYAARMNSQLAERRRKKKEEIEAKEREEREKIKEFWLSLTDEERRELVKLEKEAVLKKMKEQQKHTCSCSVCGRRRTVIEEELEMLYDAYYEELEHYEDEKAANKNSKKKDVVPEEEEGFNFAKSLTVKGGILTVADDLLKNEGKKFLEMMERLAERRMRRREEEEFEEEDEEEYGEDEEEFDEEDDEDDEEEEEEMTEEQRLEEGRRMFQMFAAKMFEQRVLTAYREKVALENQQKLIEEEEAERRAVEAKKEAKALKAKMRSERKKRTKKEIG